MKRLLVACCVALALTGCVTDGSNVKKDPAIVAGNSLYAAQQTIVNIRRNVVEPCKQGIIPKQTCAQISDIYEQSKPAYDLAVDATLLYMKTPDPTNKAAVDARTIEFLKFVTDATALAVKYQVKGDK